MTCDDQPDGHGATPAPMKMDWEEVARWMAPFLSDEHGITPGARMAANLRTEEDRHRTLDPLIASLTPRDVDPVAWRRWLAGGRLPVSRKEIEQVTAPGRARSQKLLKAGARVKTAAGRVSAARARLDAAEAALVQEQNFETALLQQVVTGHLVEALAPMFAMGPAWTILRAIAAEPEQEDVERALNGIALRNVAAVEKQVRDERADYHQTICEGLVRHGDNEEFRATIRLAILDAVNWYDKKDPGSTSVA